MLRKMTLLLLVGLLSLLVAVPAFAGAPTFEPAIWGDGQLWATKGVTELPAPNDNNSQSFDKLFVITNFDQLPVSEAAPGNPDYNGGRWFTHTVTWDNPDGAELLTSYADIMDHLDDLTITSGSPGGPGAPPDYFECPLLPVK